MANTTISALSSLTGASVASGDLFIVRDVSASQEKSITATELTTAILGNAAADPFYTTGTFTPEVADATAGGNIGSGTFYGHYVKIGKQVTLTMSLVNINTTGMTTTADFYIRNLPYSAGSVTGSVIHVGNVMAHTIDFNTNTYMGAAIFDNTSYIRLFETTDASSTDYITVSNISSGVSDMYITITYFAAS